jgi:hypothetical protein
MKDLQRLYVTKDEFILASEIERPPHLRLVNAEDSAFIVRARWRR